MDFSAFNFLKKNTVLIIEDDNALRKVLHDRLTEEKWRIIDATNGQDGLSFALEEHPDVILLDLMLPKMDGMTFLSELRKDDWGKTAKAIIMSNLMQGPKLTEQAKHFGVIEYVEKADMSLELIVEKIKKIV